MCSKSFQINLTGISYDIIKKSFCPNETMRKSDVVMILSELNKCIVDDASMIKGGM